MKEKPAKKSRRTRLHTITVTAVSPDKYPNFNKNNDNFYAQQSDNVRLLDVVDICAKALVQASWDRAASKVKESSPAAGSGASAETSS
jgi:hypothetical protein